MSTPANNNNIFSLMKRLTNALRCTFTCYAIETILTTNRTDSLQYTDSLSTDSGDYTNSTLLTARMTDHCHSNPLGYSLLLQHLSGLQVVSTGFMTFTNH